MAESSVMQPMEDDRSAAGLAGMRLRATALLVIAAAIFVAARLIGGGGAMGYVEAAAEAAMIGGLADWFAVTALFRHPLRLPIPHTAIISTRKDALAESLGEFVETNLLDDTVISDRLGDLEPGRRLGEWLDDDEHATQAAARVAVALGSAVDLLDEDLVKDETGRFVIDRLRAVRIAPVLGRVVGASTRDGRTDQLLDRVLAGAVDFLATNRPVFRGQLGKESPWWVPDWVDDRVYARIEGGLSRFAADVRSNPDHPFRRQLVDALHRLEVELLAGEGRSIRVEELWHELLDLPEIRGWAGSLWSTVHDDVLSTLDDPDGLVQQRLSGWLRSLGVRLCDEIELQRTVDGWLATAVDRMLGSVRSEIGAIITTTVQRWDGDDTSRRIELAVGRDLQFIRINGTLVGALLGLIIHAVGDVLA